MSVRYTPWEFKWHWSKPNRGSRRSLDNFFIGLEVNRHLQFREYIVGLWWCQVGVTWHREAIISPTEPSDTERIDWLEKTGATINYRMPLPDLPDDVRQAFWDRPHVVSTVRAIGWVGATLRDAIDKAMAEQEIDEKVDRMCREERNANRRRSSGD